MPNYSTLCYAEQRLCIQPVFEHLLQQTLQQVQAQQVIKGPSDIAVDATCLETHHESRYYIKRKSSPRTSRYGWLKLSLAYHLAITSLPARWLAKAKPRRAAICAPESARGY